MESTVAKSLRYGTLAVAFLVPWITFGKWVYPHTTSKVFLFYGLVSILTALWLYLMSTDSRYRLHKKEWLMISPLILYVLWMTVSGLVAKNVGFAFWGTLMRGTGLLTLYFTTLYVCMIVSLSKRYDGYVYTLLKWIVVSGAIVALSVWLGDEGLKASINVLKKGSGGGVTGNSSLAGAYLLFILGFAALLLTLKQSKKTWLWIVIGVIMLSPLFINVIGLTNWRGIFGSARGAFLGISIGAIVAGFVYLSLSFKKSLRIAGISGLLLGVIVFGVSWSQLMTPGTTLHQTFIDETSGTRFAFWHIAQQAMNERPFVGYGPENYSVAQSRYFDPQFLSFDFGYEAWTDHPHNVYFDNGVSAGYPGIALYFIFVGSLIYILYKNKTLTNLQRAILIGTIVGYLVQDLVAFDGFLTIVAVAVFAASTYGLTVTTEQKNIIKEKSWYPIVLASVLLASMIGVYYFSLQPARKAKLFGEVLGSKLDQRPARYKEFLNGSVVGNYWDVGGFGYDEYKLYAKNPIKVKSDTNLLPYAIEDVDAYIAYLEEIAKTNKTDYRLYYTLINLYNTKIFFSDISYNPTLASHISDLLEYGQKLAPTDPRMYWLRAQLAAWKGDIDGVIAEYKKGIAIDPTLPVTHRLLFGFLEQLGDQKRYSEALLYAKKEIPGFILK